MNKAHEFTEDDIKRIEDDVIETDRWTFPSDINVEDNYSLNGERDGTYPDNPKGIVNINS